MNIVKEFSHEIIEVFEAYLRDKGIEIPNEERDDNDPGEGVDNAIIYGCSQQYIVKYFRCNVTTELFIAIEVHLYLSVKFRW